MITRDDFVKIVERAGKSGSISMYLPDPKPNMPNRTVQYLFHVREIAKIGRNKMEAVVFGGSLRVLFSDMVDVQVFVK